MVTLTRCGLALCLVVIEKGIYVTNINFQPPKCISLPFLIKWVQGKITRNREIDIRANWLVWSAWGPQENNQ